MVSTPPKWPLRPSVTICPGRRSHVKWVEPLTSRTAWTAQSLETWRNRLLPVTSLIVRVIDSLHLSVHGYG